MEVDRLQQLWVESQKNSLTAKDKITQLEEENSLLNTRLGISDVVKVKSDKGLAEIKNEAFEQKLETAKLYNQLKRIQPVMQELKLANNKLERQLCEAKLKLEEMHVNSSVTFSYLRLQLKC
jgi:chromosome segregation ATPase